VVRPSSAVRKYQNQPVDVPTAGEDLHADFVLAGHYLKEADAVRLNVELVAAQSNELVWREAIDVKYENTFKLQDIVSKKVLRGLKVQFPKAAKEGMQADVPGNPIAYEYYLRGVSYPTTLADNRLAIEMFEKSVELDPAYAPAYAELGYRLGQEAGYAMLGAEGLRRAETALRKALSLNKNQFAALWNLAILYINAGKHQEAADVIQQMFRVTPNNANAHFVLSYLFRYVGMMEESVREVEAALALDPRNPRFRSAGFTYVYAGDYQQAYAAFALDEKSAPAIAWQGLALFLLGDKEGAIERIDRATAIEPGGFIGLRFGAIGAFIKGQTQEGLSSLRKLEGLLPTGSDAELWYALGDTLALFGDKVGCIRSLRKALEEGFFNYPAMLKSPWLDAVRDDPEFQKVLAVAKEKHEAFKRSFLLKRGG
jgi:tetratricopeptide (TPR) repeat protein